MCLAYIMHSIIYFQLSLYGDEDICQINLVCYMIGDMSRSDLTIQVELGFVDNVYMSAEASGGQNVRDSIDHQGADIHIRYRRVSSFNVLVDLANPYGFGFNRGHLVRHRTLVGLVALGFQQGVSSECPNHLNLLLLMFCLLALVVCVCKVFVTDFIWPPDL